MTHLSQYVLLSLNIVLVIAWLGTWKSNASARARLWQAYTAIAAVPIAALSQIWWIWPTSTLSLIPAWSRVEAVVATCLLLSLASTWSRRWLHLQFLTSVRLNWLRYTATFLIILLLGLISSQLLWPTMIVYTVAFVLISLIGISFFRSSAITTYHVVSGLLLIAALTLIITISSIITGQRHGIHIGSLYIWLNGQQLSALAAFAFAWPVLVGWWLDQLVHLNKKQLAQKS